MPVGDVGQGGDRPQLAGHVGGRGDHQELGPLDGRQGLVRRAHRLPGERGGRQPYRVGPGEQGSVVLGLEDHDGGALGQATGQQVRRVGGVAGEHDGVTGTGADEGPHGVPGLLVARRGELGGVPGAPVHAGVGRERGGDGGAHRLQTGGARGVVEVGVPHEPAALDRDLQLVTENGGDGRSRTVRFAVRCRAGPGVSGGVQAGNDGGRAVQDSESRQRRPPWVMGPRPWRCDGGARACPAHLAPDLVLTRGTPPRARGLPASKPGLDADTHDLRATITQIPLGSATSSGGCQGSRTLPDPRALREERPPAEGP